MRVGIVKNIIGLAIAKDAKGVERVLKIGDEIALGESVSTQGIDSKVIIGLEGGKELVVKGNDVVKVDQSVALGESFGNETIADVAALQKALLQGEDIADLGETAAGEGAQGTGQLNDNVFDESGHESNIYANPINFNIGDRTLDIGTNPLGSAQEKPTYNIVLTAVDAEEGDEVGVVYTATIYDVRGLLVTAVNDITITLSNGQIITIKAGQSSGTYTIFDSEDVLIDTKAHDIGIVGVSEAHAGTVLSMGAFEFNPALVSATTADTTNDVRVELKINDTEDKSVSAEEASDITLTVSFSQADLEKAYTQDPANEIADFQAKHNDVKVVVLETKIYTDINGEEHTETKEHTVTIKKGDLSGDLILEGIVEDNFYKANAEFKFEMKDVYEVDADGNKITDKPQGAFENLLLGNTDPFTVTVDDVPTPVYAKIVATGAIEGGELSYTVSLVDKDGNAINVPKDKTVTVELDFSKAISEAKGLDITKDVEIKDGANFTYNSATEMGTLTITGTEVTNLKTGEGGTSSATFTVKAVDDYIADNGEGLTVTISNVTDVTDVNDVFENLTVDGGVIQNSDTATIISNTATTMGEGSYDNADKIFIKLVAIDKDEKDLSDDTRGRDITEGGSARYVAKLYTIDENGNEHEFTVPVGQTIKVDVMSGSKSALDGTCTIGGDANTISTIINYEGKTLEVATLQTISFEAGASRSEFIIDVKDDYLSVQDRDINIYLVAPEKPQKSLDSGLS